MNSRLSLRLAETEKGQSFYCLCRGRVTLEFMERPFVFERGELPRFRDNLSKLIDDRLVLESLIKEAKKEAKRLGQFTDTLPSLADLKELLNLVDVSLLVLEAQHLISRQGSENPS